MFCQPRSENNSLVLGRWVWVTGQKEHPRPLLHQALLQDKPRCLTPYSSAATIVFKLEMFRAGCSGHGTFSLGMEIVSPSFERLKVVILNQEQFCPARDFGQSDDIFGCHNWGRKCHWHQVDRDQGCCSPSYGAKDDSP